MSLRQQRRRFALAILLTTAAINAPAKTFVYRGDLQISAMSGANCIASHTASVPITLYIRDDGKPESYEAYVVSGFAPNRLHGRRLDELGITTPNSDPELANRARASLDRLGGDELSGEVHAASVPAEATTCFIDKAAFKLARISDPHLAESFELARDDFQWYELYARNDYARALPAAREALAFATRNFGPNDDEVRRALSLEVQTLAALGQWAGCVPPLQRMVAIDEQVHQSKGPELAGSLTALGTALRSAHQDEEAEKVLRRAFAVEGQSPDQHAGIVIQLAQIKSANAAEKYREAEIVLREEVTKEEQANDPDKLAAALFQLGTLTAGTGRYAEAEPLLRRSLALGAQAVGPDVPRLASTLGALGMVLNNTGRFSEAQQMLRHAVALAEKSKNEALLADQLQKLSWNLHSVGRYAESEALARRALQMMQDASPRNEAAIGKAKEQLASVLTSMQRYAEAETYRREVVALAEKYLGPEDATLGYELGRLGHTLVAEHKYQEAAPLVVRSISIEESTLGPESAALPASLVDSATLMREGGRYAEAETLLERAFRLARTLDIAMDWLTAGSLMRLYGDPHVAQPAIAIYYGKQAVNAVQGLRGHLDDPSSDQSFLDKMAPVYRDLAELLVQQGRLGEAQQVLAMLKEQELKQFTEGGAASKTLIQFNDAEKKLAAQDDVLIDLEKQSLPLQTKLRVDGQLSAADKASLEEIQARRQFDEKIFAAQSTVAENSSDPQLDALAGQYVALGREYGALQEKFKKAGELVGADRARLQELRTAMDSAQATFDARASEVAKSSNDPEARKRRRQEINDFSRAFEGTLKTMGHDAVLAQYFILDDKVAILLTTPNAVVAREAIIQRQKLNELILNFRRALGNPNVDPTLHAQLLYKVLIDPIAADLRQAGAKTLMLDLDDTLRYLPFAALYDGKAYLIEYLSMVMVTEAVRDKLSARPNPEEWKVWGLGVTKAGLGYEALPYAGVELNGIAGREGVLAGKVMLDKAFTEASLRDGLDLSYPIVHIASHFQFTPGSMDDSFLLLGDGSRMTLAQIRTKLNFSSVELLTLSACETALGDESVAHHGVEVEGLGALAQEAGAKAVVATLWPVADESTAALMRELYQAHKVYHFDKADSLRQAQLALLHGTVKAAAGSAEQRGLARKTEAAAGQPFKVNPNAPYAHPFYWAPFVLMGNWL
jgi:CHAT domain-containing protein/tetratricopeptide (TPR) repeat protein